jgi:hypothetical protein
MLNPSRGQKELTDWRNNFVATHRPQSEHFVRLYSTLSRTFLNQITYVSLKPTPLLAFAQLRNPTVSLIMPVYPSVRLSERPSTLLSFHIEQLDSHSTDFDEIWYLNFFFRNSVENLQVSLTSDENNRCFTWRHFHIYDDNSLNSSQNEKYSRQRL